MKISMLSDNSVNSNDINQEEINLKKLIEEFNEAKTVLRFNNYQFNIPLAAIGGDITNDNNNNDNNNNNNIKNVNVDGSQLVVSSFTQLIRLFFGIIVLYGLVFMLYLLNAPNEF